MKKFLIIFFVCCIGLSAKSQFIDTLQSTINSKGSFSFSFNSRESFITNHDGHMFGYLVGVKFGDKLFIGGGFNALTSTIYKPQPLGDTSVQSTLSFSYVSYYISYIINLTKHWKLTLTPVFIGIGGSSYQYTYKGVPHTVGSHLIIPYEPGVELDYNFNKYWGLYTQLNYRFMLVNNPAINEDFNSFTYSYGILIYPLEIFAGIFPRTKLAHTIEGH